MKKRLLPGIAALACILLALILICARYSLAPGTGTYIEVPTGESMIIMGRSPVLMHGRDTLFEGLETGDQILILHNGIDTSFPGETGVFFCLRLGSGDLSAVPQATLEELRQSGWLAP